MGWRARIDVLESESNYLQNRVTDLLAAKRKQDIDVSELQKKYTQLVCKINTGHDLNFDRIEKSVFSLFGGAPVYIFKCTKCGAEMVKRIGQLSGIEADALRALGYSIVTKGTVVLHNSVGAKKGKSK